MTGAVNFEPHLIAIEPQRLKRVGQKLLIRPVGDPVRPVFGRKRPIGVGISGDFVRILDIGQNGDEIGTGKLEILRIGVFFELNVILLNRPLQSQKGGFHPIFPAQFPDRKKND